MTRPTRRDVLVAGVGLAGATAGCLSNATEDDGTPTSTGAGAGDLLPTPVAGDPDADVTVAVYEDYACPHCRTYSEEVFPQVEEIYLSAGTVRYEFHDFPIPVDETVSWQAASAARAGGESGTMRSLPPLPRISRSCGSPRAAETGRETSSLTRIPVA